MDFKPDWKAGVDASWVSPTRAAGTLCDLQLLAAHFRSYPIGNMFSAPVILYYPSPLAALLYIYSSEMSTLGREGVGEGRLIQFTALIKQHVTQAAGCEELAPCKF